MVDLLMRNSGILSTVLVHLGIAKDIVYCDLPAVNMD